MSRGMQNFTAKYNYLYNAKAQLQFYETQLQHEFPFNHHNILPLYPSPLDTLTGQTALNQIIAKAQLIISEKNHSNYVADSYLLLAKAHYLKSNYFLAEAYYDYVIKNYADDLYNLTEALSGKARSVMQLGQLTAAKPIIDSLETTIRLLKKPGSAPLATLAQYYILIQQYQQSIFHLQHALTAHPQPRQMDIWQYVLAQLHERQKNYPLALQHYTKVKHSPALYFRNPESPPIQLNKSAPSRIILKDNLLDPDEIEVDTTALTSTLRKGQNDQKK